MNSQDQTGAAETKQVEHALESIAQGQRDVGLYFDTATGELRTSRHECGEDVDRLPATRMAREGFFAGGRLPAMSRSERLDVEKATLSKMTCREEGTVEVAMSASKGRSTEKNHRSGTTRKRR